MVDQPITRVAVFDLEKIRRPSRPAHQHVGERARCTQVDLAGHVDLVGRGTVVLDGVHAADVTANLLQKKPKLAEKVWIV
jgi:hypothetical protein